jgi:hypothetical protein
LPDATFINRLSKKLFGQKAVLCQLVECVCQD